VAVHVIITHTVDEASNPYLLWHRVLQHAISTRVEGASDADKPQRCGGYYDMYVERWRFRDLRQFRQVVLSLSGVSIADTP